MCIRDRVRTESPSGSGAGALSRRVALRRARRVATVSYTHLVDEFLKDEVSPDSTAAERCAQYTGFGPDPFIVTDDPDAAHPPFSAWNYAKERCEEG